MKPLGIVEAVDQECARNIMTWGPGSFLQRPNSRQGNFYIRCFLQEGCPFAVPIGELQLGSFSWEKLLPAPLTYSRSDCCDGGLHSRSKALVSNVTLTLENCYNCLLVLYWSYSAVSCTTRKTTEFSKTTSKVSEEALLYQGGRKGRHVDSIINGLDWREWAAQSQVARATM